MLEVKIEELTKAVIALTELIGKIEAGKDVKPEPVKAEKPVAELVREGEILAKQIEMVSKPAPVVEAAPVMPAAPTFEPVAAEPAGAKAPFTDGKGLIDYVMTVYKELGAEKGAGIQGVLTEMGLANVNEVRATEYDTFFAKVEALK
jgi:hypothetical protein